MTAHSSAEGAYLVANTTYALYLKVLPSDADMLMGETRTFGSSGGGAQILAQVELIVRLALLDLVARIHSRIIRVDRCLKRDDEPAMET